MLLLDPKVGFGVESAAGRRREEKVHRSPSETYLFFRLSVLLFHFRPRSLPGSRIFVSRARMHARACICTCSLSLSLSSRAEGYLTRGNLMFARADNIIADSMPKAAERAVSSCSESGWPKRKRQRE
jgi:hypothetical protein